MYCKNCGKKLSNNENFCTNCGVEKTNIINSDTTITNEELKEDNNCNILCGISLLLYLASDIILLPLLTNNSDNSSGILGISSLVGLVLMIIARVKYPKKTFPKILMWLYIAKIIIAIILLIIVCIACVSCVNNAQGCE